MDSFVLKKIIDELKDILPGSLVSKIYQPGKREILFELWKPGGGHRLFISAHPLFCSVHTTEHELENPPKPPRFCQALRKHLSGTRIRDIELIELERAFTIHFTAKGGSEESQQFSLVAELFGRHANVILLDGNSTIINALNIVTKDETGVREVASGILYSRLPPLPKTFLPDVTLDTCRQILTDSWDDIPRAIQRNVHGISKDVVSQIDLSKEPNAEALLAAFEELTSTYRDGNFRVAIRREKEEKIILLPVISEEAVSANLEYFESASKAADTFFHYSYVREQFFSTKNRLHTVLRKRKKREEKKRKRVEEDIAKLETLKELGRKGELLKQSLHAIKKGQRECSVLDYSQTPPAQALIELDPSLSPVENMNRYFRLYKKGQRGITMKRRFLPQIEEEIGYLDSLQYYVDEAKKIDELKHLEREMTELGFMRRRARKEKKRVKKLKKESPVVQVEKKSLKDFTVYIGKNNRGNDHIVKNIASPGDIWLHARHYPGSHVLIKKPKNEDIPDDLIHLIGREAARRSGGAPGGKVEVFVADAKDVRKIPGQKPGMVRIRRYRTIMVETENHSS